MYAFIHPFKLAAPRTFCTAATGIHVRTYVLFTVDSLRLYFIYHFIYLMCYLLCIPKDGNKRNGLAGRIIQRREQKKTARWGRKERVGDRTRVIINSIIRQKQHEQEEYDDTEYDIVEGAQQLYRIINDPG